MTAPRQQTSVPTHTEKSEKQKTPKGSLTPLLTEREVGKE